MKKATKQPQMTIPSDACNLNERLLPIEQRSKLCYWFPISTAMLTKLNETNEQLLEAELHLYKLKPLLANNNQQQIVMASNGHLAPDNRQTRDVEPTQKTHVSETPNDDNRLLGPSNLYHLKTNLLEVSLYQVLPRSSSDGRELPLRLLDIRRIDLHSTGWEAFYVKRAVQDWTRDGSLNLGLVIKTKSMFDEPVRIGLIRFADMYDSAESSVSQQDVDLQPTLIIYTTSTRTK